MPFSAETTVRSCILRPLARLALAVVLSVGLAGCGGGGSGGGGQVMIVPDPQAPAQDPQPPEPATETPSPESPDLVVESSSVSDPAPAAGAEFALSTRVRNAGDGAAAATVRFYLSDDAAITASDEEVGAFSAAELAASGGAAASVSLKAPQAPGTYYYGACVAAAPGESDAANNCSPPVLVTVPGSAAAAARGQAPSQQAHQSPALVRQVPKQALPQPDLVVESPSASDANPLAGAGFTLSATVRNAGNADAAATTARFYRSADASITASDTEAGSKAVSGLAASGSVAASLALTAPQTLGTYYYGVCVDAVAGESDTADNCSAPVRVTVVRPPDLVVLRPSFSDTNPFVGRYFKITATVRNDGGKASGRTRLRIYQSTDETITRSDTQVEKAHDFRGVRPSKTWKLGRPLQAWVSGTYYYGACVDAVAGESDAANNCSPSVKVTVRPPPPADLVVDARGVYPAAPAAGGVLSLRVTLRNAGGKSVGRMTVRYYRSDDATITTSDTELTARPRTNQPAWTSYKIHSGGLDAPSSPGTYYYGACVDAVAGESDTTNNCSAAMKVKVTPPRPNLKFYSSGRYSWRGSEFGLSVGLVNTGGPSAATTLRFYHSTDKKITTNDTELADVAVPALEKTESGAAPKFSSGVVYLPGPTTPGTHHYGVCVDAVENESNTADNCAGPIHTIRR